MWRNSATELSYNNQQHVMTNIRAQLICIISTTQKIYLKIVQKIASTKSSRQLTTAFPIVQAWGFSSLLLFLFLSIDLSSEKVGSNGI